MAAMPPEADSLRTLRRAMRAMISSCRFHKVDVGVAWAGNTRVPPRLAHRGSRLPTMRLEETAPLPRGLEGTPRATLVRAYACSPKDHRPGRRGSLRSAEWRKDCQ